MKMTYLKSYHRKTSCLSLFKPQSFIRENKSTASSLSCHFNSKNNKTNASDGNHPNEDISKNQNVFIPLSDIDMPTMVAVNGNSSLDDKIELKLPLLKKLVSATIDEFPLLFSQKINLCKNICNFSKDSYDSEAKIIKGESLKEILSYISNKTFQKNITTDLFQELFTMINININRSFMKMTEAQLNYDEEPHIIDLSMNHLSTIYSILLILIENKIFDRKDFIPSLLNNLNSPDLKERETVSKILLCIYHMYPDERAMLLKRISLYLSEYCDNTIPPFVVWPSLLILSDIFQKEISFNYEMIVKIFWRNIAPLMVTRHLASFSSFQKKIILLILSSSVSASEKMMKRVINNFPIMCANKQVCFVEVLENICEKMASHEFKLNAKLIFRFYARCAECKNSKVADASFKIWFNLKLQPKLVENAKDIYPIIHGPVINASRDHWNPTIQNRALAVLKVMRDCSPFLVDELNSQRLFTAKKEPKPIRPLQKSWALIARAAKQEDQTFDLQSILSMIQFNFNESQPITAMTTYTGGYNYCSRPKLLSPANKNDGKQWR